MLKMQLRRAGASVSMFESGDHFLDKGGQSDFPWDVVVLDFTMPGRNGLETLQEIPEQVKARLTVIMHTSEPSQHLMDTFLAAGAIACVPKKPKASKVIVDLIAKNADNRKPAVAHGQIRICLVDDQLSARMAAAKLINFIHFDYKMPLKLKHINAVWEDEFVKVAGGTFDEVQACIKWANEASTSRQTIVFLD